MNNFRSICIVYNMEDTYRAYYIKEFFKWIGLSYVAVVNKPGRNIFDNEKYLEFDVIVNYNDAIENDQCLKIQERTKNTLISVSDRDKRSEEDLLHALLCEIVESVFDGNVDMQELLTDIAAIYMNEHAVDLLYEYTFILLSGISEDIGEDILNRITSIEEQVEKLIQNNRAWDKNKGLEYALYAMYYSRKQINEFQWMKKRPLIYDTEKYLNEVNEIYHYDENFFKVESLKAKVAEFDNRFSALPKFFLENAIQDCPISLCKSYHFYTLGKWKERNSELFEASVSYRKAYFEDPSNFKTIFKLAVEQKRLEDNLLAESLFREIIRELSVLFTCKEEMSLREIEYLYKAYMLIASVCEEQFQNWYYEKARECLEYIESMIIESDKKDFALKMYGSEQAKKSIAEAMRFRLGSNIWNCVQGKMEEDENEKQKDKTGKCIYLRDLLNRGIHFDETSQFETSFFSDVYENAIDAVEEIVNDNRKKEKIVGERRKDQRVRSIANVISFIGRRGTGKSSVMMSFQDALRQYTNDYYQCEKYNNLIFGKEADMGNVRFFSLDYIDASALEESEDVFILVLANMLNYLYSLKSFSDEYNDNSKRELISSFERIYEEFLTLKNSRQDRDGVYSSFETLLNVASSQRIRERFYNLVQQFIRYIRTNTAERAKECYMVISIDDLDMAHYNTQNSNKTRSKINNKSYEIVNSIHKYFSIPGVIVLTAYNYENLMLQSEKFFIESDKTANEKYHEKESQQMTSSRLASQFVDKVFPPAYRVYLPSWKKNDFGSSSTRIDISTGISGENLLGKYIENTDPTLTIKKFILALYAEKTSIFYDPLGKKIHFLEPDSLRKIVDIVAIFEGVEKTEDYTEQKERILKKIKADAYFRFVQEKLFLSEERTYFAELQELRIDRRSQEIVREFCGKIPRLGKAVKKDSDQYRKNMKKIALKKGDTVVDYSKIDDIIAKREDNSNIKYSLAEFIHCIYHMTRNSEKYSKEMVACILNSYTVHLSELFFEYQNEKRKMDMNEYTSYMQSKRNDVMLKSQQQNEEDHDYEKINEIQEIFEELIGDSVCGRWTEYFFPETYVFIPGAADPSNISENVIIGCANITHLTNRFTITSSHKKGLYHAVRTWIMFGMIYVDVLEWNSLDVVMEQSESNASITIQIPGNTQRIEMLAFLKHSFEYSKYLDKMKELMEYSLLHKFGFRTERNIKMTVNRAIEDVREEYIKWDYNYGNMALPVYDFDLFYNLIKRIYQQTSKTERCVRIDTGYDFMDEMIKTNQLFVDYLNQIDEYYKIDSNLKFSEIFEQCPFVQWIHEKKDEEVMKSIGYIFKNMITDVATNANRLERSGDDVPRTDV